VLSNIEAIGKLCNNYGCLFLVDVVATMVMVPIKVDAWHIDIAYCNGQKGLSCAPGVSPITISDRALWHLKNRKTPVNSYVFDLNRIMKYWFEQTEIVRTYHHTAPVNSLYGLHEALRMVANEGLEVIQERYRKNAEMFTVGLESMAFEMPVPKDIRIPILNVISKEDSWATKDIVQRMLYDHGVQISEGLGKMQSHMLRLSAMGPANNAQDITYALNALSKVLRSGRYTF
jgi:alanine-glyoxylate transaminase/serine-glyoxylate transaminase/serine-pyruvate transaminase